MRILGVVPNVEISKSGATANVNYAVAASQMQQLDCLLAPGLQRTDAAGIIALCPSAIAIDALRVVSGHPISHASSPSDDNHRCCRSPELLVKPANAPSTSRAR